MDWYVVIKTIKGRRYRYRQKTWREDGRVRTRSEYLGRAGDDDREPRYPDLAGAVTLPLPFAAPAIAADLIEVALAVLTDESLIASDWEESWDTDRRGAKSLVVADANIERLVLSLNVKRTYRDAGAYYRPATDELNMPPKNRFVDRSDESATEAYYSTLLHELVHWTKGDFRTGRQSESGRNGYAREELVAELGAIALARHFGVASDYVVTHVTYFQGWLGAVDDREEALTYAKREAERAVRFILERGIISP